MKNSSCIIGFLIYTPASFEYAKKITHYFLQRFNSPYTRINSLRQL